MNTQIIVALDIARSSEIEPLLSQLPQELLWFKVGLELFCAEGPRALEPLQRRGRKIFLDLKLHDIPRTVERAVQSAARHGIHMLSIHASGGKHMLRAAADAAGAAPQPLTLLAITALTSLDQSDFNDLGISRTPAAHVRSLADLAVSNGVSGLVCSAQEVGDLRRLLGPQPVLVTPGIRPAGGERGDQKRLGTPAQAVRDGASFLVIGRPILEAPEPRRAAESILAEISAASRDSAG